MALVVGKPVEYATNTEKAAEETNRSDFAEVKVKVFGEFIAVKKKTIYIDFQTVFGGKLDTFHLELNPCCIFE